MRTPHWLIAFMHVKIKCFLLLMINIFILHGNIILCVNPTIPIVKRNDQFIHLITNCAIYPQIFIEYNNFQNFAMWVFIKLTILNLIITETITI